MKPTKVRELAAIFAVVAIGVWLISTRYYDRVPRLQLAAPVSLLLVAAFEGFTASAIRARLDGRPGTKPIMPILVARYAALAKASSLAAAIAAGAWTGIFAYAVAHRARFAYAERDSVYGAVGAVAALLVVLAALRLERACRVKETPEYRDPDRDRDHG